MFSKKISLFVLPFMAIASLQANDTFLNDPFGDDIFKEMYQMQKEMDKIFERMEQRTKLWNNSNTQSLLPTKRMTRNSLFDDKGTYYVYNTQIPEGQDNQIDITINNRVLHIKATVDEMKKTDNTNMKIQQHYFSMIQRSEVLPKDADASSLKSEFQNGMLILILQKNKTPAHTILQEKEEQKPKEMPTTEKEKVKMENNSTKIKVPHTSSHV